MPPKWNKSCGSNTKYQTPNIGPGNKEEESRASTPHDDKQGLHIERQREEREALDQDSQDM
eukprot:12885418-Prorocentrum_lima.AAC.1